MADTDPAATLHTLANYYRQKDVEAFSNYYAALAEHVEGIAAMHWPDEEHTPPRCDRDTMAWPCSEVRSLLAVAAAAGVTP